MSDAKAGFFLYDILRMPAHFMWQYLSHGCDKDVIKNPEKNEINKPE